MFENHSDDSAIINLQDALEEEEENDIIQFHLSSEIIQIHIHQLCKYSHLIQKEFQQGTELSILIPTLEQKFKKYQIKDKNIKFFFQLLKKEKMEITSNQYIDLCKLAEIFEVSSLKKLLRIYYQKFSKNLNLIINLMLEENSFEVDYLFPHNCLSNEFEECLINNIDKCFNIDIFGQLPISTIYRIIEKSNLNNITNDFLYDFIMKSIEKRYCLFNFLCIQKLSNEKFNDLYQNYQSLKDTKRYFEYIKNDLIYLKDLRDAKQSLENKVKELKQTKIHLENENSKIQQKKLQVENENEELKKIKIQLINENLQIKTKNQQMQNQIEQNNNIINKLENENRVLHEQQSIVNADINKLQVQLEEVIDSKNKLQNALDQVTQENKQNITLNKKLEDENKDIKSQLDQMKKNEDVSGLKKVLNEFQGIKNVEESEILHYACKLGCLEFVKFLLSSIKFDINSKNIFFYYPL